MSGHGMLVLDFMAREHAAAAAAAADGTRKGKIRKVCLRCSALSTFSMSNHGFVHFLLASPGWVLRL